MYRNGKGLFFFSGRASRARVLEISPFDLPKPPPVTQAKVWLVTFSLFSVSNESMIQICYLLIMNMGDYEEFFFRFQYLDFTVFGQLVQRQRWKFNYQAEKKHG